MKDDTLWDAEPHTLAKLKILRSYLGAWMPILARAKGTHRHIRYIDGFAGPGVYEGGEAGSPVVALDVALAHSSRLEKPVRMSFIEIDERRAARLQHELDRRWDEGGEFSNVSLRHVHNGRCEEILPEALQQLRDKREPFGPALVFLDQFGHSLVSMSLIRDLLREKRTEVFTYLSWKSINRFITDSSKADGFSKAFGSTEWFKAIDLEPKARERFLLSLYHDALRQQAGADFSCHFAMHDSGDQLLYWLFFASNNIRGLEVMKKSMWRVDDTGEFRFSDKHQESPMLLAGYDDGWLAAELSRCLAGQTRSIAEIRDHVLKETPCYLYNGALALLEKQERIQPINEPEGRRCGSFVKYVDDPQFRVAFKGL